MKRVLTILLLAVSLSSYAIDVDLLKQSLVGTWHPSRRWGNDNPNDENKLHFYLDDDRLMVRYVADYSSVYDKDRNEFVNVFNKFATCQVDVHYDGTIEFSVRRKMMGYDKRGREERVGGNEYFYNLSFVDGGLVGTETRGNCYLLMQSTDDRGICKYKTLEQAERRGELHEFPFGKAPFTSAIDYYNSDKTNIKKFYKNGDIDELSNCDPQDYKYGFLIGWYQGTWNCYGYGYSKNDYNIRIFIRDGKYYLKYCTEDIYSHGIVQIYPSESNGEVSFAFSTKQQFIEECDGNIWPWNYDFTFNVRWLNDEMLVGTREWTSVSGPIKLCDPEPENCNVVYYKINWK